MLLVLYFLGLDGLLLAGIVEAPGKIALSVLMFERSLFGLEAAAATTVLDDGPVVTLPSVRTPEFPEFCVLFVGFL